MGGNRHICRDEQGRGERRHDHEEKNDARLSKKRNF